jgi:hypothetical protein
MQEKQFFSLTFKHMCAIINIYKGGINMTDFSKETKLILKEEGLTPKKMQFIFDEICKVNWKARKIKETGATWKNLNPHIIKALIEQYNNHTINLITGEIIIKGE